MMTDDIVTRLRKRHETEGWIDDTNVEVDAVDEIERLREHIDYLKGVIEMLCKEIRDLKEADRD